MWFPVGSGPAMLVQFQQPERLQFRCYFGPNSLGSMELSLKYQSQATIIFDDQRMIALDSFVSLNTNIDGQTSRTILHLN